MEYKLFYKIKFHMLVEVSVFPVIELLEAKRLNFSMNRIEKFELVIITSTYVFVAICLHIVTQIIPSSMELSGSRINRGEFALGFLSSLADFVFSKQ